MPGNENYDALCEACKKNDKERVEVLLKDPNTQVNENLSGISPLQIAVFAGYVEILKMLLERKELDVNNDFLFQQAVEYSKFVGNREECHQSIIAELLKRSDLNFVANLYQLCDLRHELKFHDEKNHEAIAQVLIEPINSVQHIHHLVALFDAIGIGKGNQGAEKGCSAAESFFSLLRCRKLWTLNHFDELGYRETNDSEVIARAVIERAKQIISEKQGRLSSEEHEQCESLFDRKITRRTKKKHSIERKELLQWLDDIVKKPEAEKQPVNYGFN